MCLYGIPAAYCCGKTLWEHNETKSIRVFCEKSMRTTEDRPQVESCCMLLIFRHWSGPKGTSAYGIERWCVPGRGVAAAAYAAAAAAAAAVICEHSSVCSLVPLSTHTLGDKPRTAVRVRDNVLPVLAGPAGYSHDFTVRRNVAKQMQSSGHSRGKTAPNRTARFCLVPKTRSTEPRLTASHRSTLTTIFLRLKSCTRYW